MELGGPIENFRLDAFVTAINELVRCDETIRALWLIDNLPGYYRDNIPPEVSRLKKDILKRIATPRFYSKGDRDCQLDLNNEYKMDQTLRGKLILKDLEVFNARQIVPHIVDIGPGEFWLPIVAKMKGYQFTYKPLYLNEESFQTVKPHIERHLSDDFKGRPVIYVACELIEHLWNESEIKTEMLIECEESDIVHISTPRYTFDPRDIDWREKTLGHLRTYTPSDFCETIKHMFPEYNHVFYDSVILHGRLVLKNTKFRDFIISEYNIAHIST